MASVDPRAARHIDERVLLRLLPGAPQEDFDTIRSDFAGFLNRPLVRKGYPTWQDGWNAWTGATAGSAGSITYRPTHCHACRGRGFDTSNIGRNVSHTGSPYICGECSGSRRGQATQQVALHAQPPQGEPS